MKEALLAGLLTLSGNLPEPPKNFNHQMYNQPSVCAPNKTMLEFLKKSGAVPGSIGIMSNTNGKMAVSTWKLSDHSYVMVLSIANTGESCITYVVEDTEKAGPTPAKSFN